MLRVRYFQANYQLYRFHSFVTIQTTFKFQIYKDVQHALWNPYPSKQVKMEIHL